ncbi:MAG: RdgB/HAM1 family non-canonical purine NTP pyrophosphatase [Bacteroides sp.]|nr:RdgB/HAM1 family non-canonical purine NTP pyrophosphatase [Bacteroides sp.]
MEKKQRLVMATNNLHKLKEARAIIGDAFELVSLTDAGVSEDLPETSDTLEGNALQKARRVYELTGLDCFADDTGLMVDALGGAPGVYSARYAGGEGHDAEANMKKLLAELEAHDDRAAHFSTVIALIRGGREDIFEGRVDGRIARERSGANGFGYDPVFVADETGLPFAEMSEEAKNAISHRGRALRAMIAAL